MANKNLLIAGVAYTSLITTGLNSLADATATAASSAINNTTNLNTVMDIAIMLGSFNPSGSPYIEIRKLELNGDGSTYDDSTTSSIIGAIAVATGSSAKVGTLIGVPLTLGQFKIIAVNRTGTTLAASANTLYYRTYATQNNG
jgi:hypothetical protein